MRHAVFDRPTYAWDRREAADLYELLKYAIPDRREIRRLFAEAGGDVATVNYEQGSADIWRDALDRLASSGGLRKLCEEVLPESKAASHPRFPSVLAAVREAAPAFERRVIGGVAVLDRRPLRDYVANLQSDGALRALLVRGDSKSGKTHGRHIFLSAARESGAKPVYLYAPLIATVDDVIGELFSALETDEVPVRNTTEQAWYQAVCRKLAGVAGAKRLQVWLAIDDLGAASEPDGAPLLDQHIAQFCETFVLHLGNPTFAEWFRLMLIHYREGDPPTRWLRDVWAEDRPTVADITQADVEDYLRDWAADRGRTVAFPESIAADVLNEADDASASLGVPRLQRIHEILLARLRDEEQTGP